MNSDSESLQTDLLDWLLVNKANTNETKLVECEEIDGVKNPFKEVAAFTGGEP
ncbi:hypothetical protein NIES3585_31230 [Nodularia sp. NIES-3585]|nr:hypothetical protein NIES3585_31230 [Nodularia sp. NIES-3585]